MKIVVRNKKSGVWDPAKHNKQLVELHAEGKSDPEISAIMGFTEGTVANKRMLLGLRANHRPLRRQGTPWQREVRLPACKPSPFALATETWGIAFDHERMRLHGTPIKFLDLMRRTNERRKEQGLEQWTGDPECVIP